MIIDAYEVPNGKTVDAEICIIGGGIIGIAIARELRSRGLGVTILESGGKEMEQDSQSLYKGDGRIFETGSNKRELPDYLHQSRLRLLGGSVHGWGGKCGIPDAEVFEKRDWIPNSGWPFSRQELMPFFDRACDTLKIPRFDYDANEIFDKDRPTFIFGPEKRLTTSPRHISPVTRRGPKEMIEAYRGSVADDPNADVYLHANVVDIVTNETGNAITQVEVATLKQGRFTVRAKRFILATGGIENVRLLLNSSKKHKNGLGNDHGLVGRYFSGHTTFANSSALYLTNRHQPLTLYQNKDARKIWGVFKTSRQTQIDHKLPNFTVSLNSGSPRPNSKDAAVMQSSFLMDGRMANPSLEKYSPRGSFAQAYFMTELAPNPESRISLDEQTDALGQQRVRMDWKFSKDDLDGLARSAKVFGQEMGASGMGRMKAVFRRDRLLMTTGPSRHHIGTTRMDENPKSGVVDTDCKVHGLENLYIAGSSVFPSGGIINPTLTIVALGMKLADHLVDIGKGA